MSAYRTTEPRSPPRVLTLRPGRGRSAVIMMLFWVGLSSLILAGLGLSISAHGLAPGLARFMSGASELARVRPSVSTMFAVYGLVWFGLFFGGIQTWRLRLDVEHHEDDDRLVFTWTRKPFRTRRLEVPRADIADVRIVVDRPERASSATHMVLVTKRETIRLGPSTGDDHAKNVATLRAFLRLDEPGAPRPDARAVASGSEREPDFAPESADRASRARRS